MDLGKKPNNSSVNNGALLGSVAVVTVLLAIGGLLIAQLTPIIFPDQASAESQQVDGLFKVMFGIGGAIFLLVEGLLLYSVVRFRKRQDDESDGPTIHGNVTLELIWTAIPTFVVIGLVVYSWQVWSDIRAPKDNASVVQVEARRFAWTFYYDDPRLEQLAEEGQDAPQVASSELHVWVGQPVRMVMNSQDVIHSFWLPEMRIKQDVIPGRTTEITFTPQAVEGKVSADYPLRYRVVCAELCGSGHGTMWSYIYIHETEEGYQAWIDQQVDMVLNPPEDPVLAGAQILASGVYGCASCHMLNATRGNITIEWAEGNVGPSLNGIADRAGTRVTGQPAEEYLYTSVLNKSAFLVPGYGNLMNPFQFTDPSAAYYMPKEDALNIVAFLCTVSDQRSLGDLETNPYCDMENLASFAETFLPSN